MTHQETDLLARLIDAKHGVLVQLRQLALRQQEWIAQGDMSRLMSLLAAKQQLLGQLQQVEQGIDPFRAQDPDRRPWRSPQDRNRCRDTAAKCEAMLAEIMDLERKSESELVQRRDLAAVRLQGLHQADRATQAYFAPLEPRGSQIDLSCET